MLRTTLLSVILVQCLAGRVPPQNDRVIGGNFADQGEYPFQVTISYLTEFVHFGAAVILNETHILTAAHCVDGIPVADLYIKVGNIHIAEGERHELVRSTVHKDFDYNNSLINDIAIVEISPPFTFGPNIQPIKLPNQGDEPAEGAVATIIGWGLTSNGGYASDLLKEVDIAISDQDLCLGLYNDAGHAIIPGQLCAGTPEGNLGSCNGDSGGPLLVDGVVVGLVSWSADGCASPNFPTIYTKVAYYIDWINQQI